MPSPEEKSLWDLAGTRIGVVAAALGLVVALVGLPHTIRDAIGQSGSSGSNLAAERDKARAGGPRLEVRYLLITDNALNFAITPSPQQHGKTVATAYPIVANDVIRQFNKTYERLGCEYEHDYSNLSVAFLELSNRGGRDATNIVVDLDRLALQRPVRVQVTVSGGDDYVAKLRSAASTSTRVKVEIPRTLGPGDGVRLPLFRSDAPQGQYDRWCALPSVAYLPITLRFDDPALATKIQSEVRRMRTPLVVDERTIELS